MNKNILLTGGAGYIGSQISTDLIKKGYNVFVIDNLVTGSKSLIPKKCTFYKKNILDTFFLKKSFLNIKYKQ